MQKNITNVRNKNMQKKIHRKQIHARYLDEGIQKKQRSNKNWED